MGSLEDANIEWPEAINIPHPMPEKAFMKVIWFTSDAIEHNKTGLICDGNNLDEIYSSLNQMIENKKYLELGKNAKELSSKFNWSNTVEEYKKILKVD